MFSACAGRLAGLAGAWLGWRPDEFWRSTPAELAAIIQSIAAPHSPASASADDLDRLKGMFPDG